MNKRSKHIDTKYHFIREKFDDNDLELVYTPTDQLAADILTKEISQVNVVQHRKVLLGQIHILPPISETSLWGC